MTNPLKPSWQPEFHRPAMIVGWSVDAGRLSSRIVSYLNEKLAGKYFAEIQPLEFFPLGGVTIENDLVQFPESRFYACPKNDLILFESTPPTAEWYRFLNVILDVAERSHVKEVYTIGGMISLGAHTTPRELRGTFNSVELKSALVEYNLGVTAEYETPPGQRPTLNSFFLWAARQRNIPAVALWVPIPFYLITVDDPRAQLKVTEFFNKALGLELDLGDIQRDIDAQNEKLGNIRGGFPEIDALITKLESNQRLSEEESQKLVKEVERFLR